MIKQIKKKARELLGAKQADLIIGYKRAPDGISAMPAFVDKEEDVEMLIWDSHCVYNLANYLKEFPGKKMGIVAKSCDAKSITVLIQENQLKKEDVFIISAESTSVITEDRYEAVRKLEAMPVQERLRFWQEEFSRCIRCYACRQVCPMCYCPRCVADQAVPGWLFRAISFEGNFLWNATRAMHLAGRCTDCGECERACPVGIPLRNINKKIEKDIAELFNYETGVSKDQKPLLSCFDKNDPGEFIR